MLRRGRRACGSAARRTDPGHPAHVPQVTRAVARPRFRRGPTASRRGRNRNTLRSRADGAAHLDFPARTVCAGTLAGTDTRDGIGGQRHDREALVIEPGTAAGKIEVQIVKAVCPAMGRQVMDVDGFHMEEEARLRLRGVACGTCSPSHAGCGAPAVQARAYSLPPRPEP